MAARAALDPRACLARVTACLAWAGLAACGDAEVLNPVPLTLMDGGGATCPELSDTNPWQDRLGNNTLANRGALLGCAHVGTLTRAGVSYDTSYPLIVGEAKNGAELFVLQYVSEGRPGQARAVTALAYLPTGDATDIATVAAGHGMFGLGSACGPSHIPSMIEPLALPLVGRGHAVLAPDYAGIGVDNGRTSFLIGASEAAATLDGVRALRQLTDHRFDIHRLGKDFFAAGWSQGGHAALFTHQLFDPASGLRFLGSIAFAPGLGSARAFAENFHDAGRPVGIRETLAAAFPYSYMLYAGGPEAGTWLTPEAANVLPEILDDDCLPSLLASVPAKLPTVGHIYQPSFIGAAAGCNFKVGCPAFEPWASALIGNEPGAFTSAAPSLILQGLADFYASPDTVACTVARLQKHGTPVEACAYAGIDHVGIVTIAAPDMLRWIEARRAGENPQICAESLAVACVSQ